mmetsp:Transcript_15986/g.39420  ORF Transcript_15986/g.39420 Transcript_15986/m.39420 type:complete len:223 (+) Transcript_15986:753-1421(+)
MLRMAIRTRLPTRLLLCYLLLNPTLCLGNGVKVTAEACNVKGLIWRDHIDYPRWKPAFWVSVNKICHAAKAIAHGLSQIPGENKTSPDICREEGRTLRVLLTDGLPSNHCHSSIRESEDKLVKDELTVCDRGRKLERGPAQEQSSLNRVRLFRIGIGFYVAIPLHWRSWKRNAPFSAFDEHWIHNFHVSFPVLLFLPEAFKSLHICMDVADTFHHREGTVFS